MSGKYLHGLIVDGLVDVRDNLFSHSELRKKWSKSQSEAKHPLIREWSWDYVNRCFVETPSDIITTAQKWIDDNLSNHKQLIAWVDRNWTGLVCGDEAEREACVWELISHKAKYKNRLVERFLKADADWKKAYADWNKADADWNKADADRNKADADRNKAYADWNKADADRNKAYADWNKAYADRNKADADWNKAYADWNKADADWNKAYADWNKADADWNKAYADWKKADADWKFRVMKPVFMELLAKYPNEHWNES